jgi:hypothetical protein
VKALGREEAGGPSGAAREGATREEEENALPQIQNILGPESFCLRYCRKVFEHVAYMWR